MSSLIQWMSASFISPDITVADFGEEGRGLKAQNFIHKNQKIISIPHSHLLNAHTVARYVCHHNSGKFPPHYASIDVKLQDPDEITDIYQNIDLDGLLRLNSFQVVSLFICLESCRKSSFWGPFFDLLPEIESFLSTPLVWEYTRKDWADLYEKLPPQTRIHAQKVKKRFINDINTVRQFLHSKAPEAVEKYITDKKYVWAWMCINSRCLYMDLKASDTADNFTMAPYVDFINHTDTDHCRLQINSKGFHVYTTTDYNAGDQMYLSYGPHSNSFLLCEYGFTIPTNRWNDLDISEDIESIATEAQKQFLLDNGYWGDYTISETSGLSYRTEIALAVLQEDNPRASRKLNAYILGVSEGQFYSRGSKRLLRDILLEFELKNVDGNDLVSRNIARLYDDIKDIIGSIEHN